MVNGRKQQSREQTRPIFVPLTSHDGANDEEDAEEDVAG